MKQFRIQHVNFRLVSVAILILTFGTTVFSLFVFDKAFAPLSPTKSPEIVKKVPKPSFDKSKYSTKDPSSRWVVVNKSHSVTPVDFAPSDLIESNGATISNKALADFNTLIGDAKTAGMKLTIVSSYRSHATQTYLYNNYVATYGQAMADTFSAKLGYSEHQTGLAIDFGSGDMTGCNLDDCFGTTKEGIWLKANASKYGFILRYIPDKQTVTGYKSEPWHYRYVGREIVTEMQKENTATLEEFFKVSGGELYK